MNEAQRAKVMQIIDNHGRSQAALIAILQAVQAEYSYLSQSNLELIAGELGITIAKAYGVATFFENFSLEAKGKHIVKVCNGTACHVRKSQPIYDAVRAHLGLTGKHKTTDDGRSMKVYEKLTALCAECGLKTRVALREEGGHDTLHFKRSGCRGYTAIAKAEEAGLLGDDILGSGFSFHLHINRGAGANGSARSAPKRAPARRRSR